MPTSPDSLSFSLFGILTGQAQGPTAVLGLVVLVLVVVILMRRVPPGRNPAKGIRGMRSRDGKSDQEATPSFNNHNGSSDEKRSLSKLTGKPPAF